MSRRCSATIAQRNAPVVQRLQSLTAKHPFCGYRRIWAYLHVVDGRVVNPKRVLRQLRSAQLLVQPNRRLRATRTPTRRKPRPTQLNQWWGIDMINVLATPVGGAYIVLVLAWHTKKIVGHRVGLHARTAEWLDALNQGVNRQCPEGVQGQGFSLMSDHGCQPTSVAFMKTCAILGITHAFTSDNNPKGNADTERVMRTLKEELLWLREGTRVLALEHAVTAWIDWYHSSSLHSTLGYRTPNAWEADHQASHRTQFKAA